MSVQHECITPDDIAFLERVAPDHGTPDGIQDADEKLFYRLCEQIESCNSCRDAHLAFHRMHL